MALLVFAGQEVALSGLKQHKPATDRPAASGGLSWRRPADPLGLANELDQPARGRLGVKREVWIKKRARS